MKNTLEHSVKHERLHALDALRAFAMMLGVWLHLAMPYTEGIERGFWAADEENSTFVSMTVLFIHSWRMELFFLLSGFFTIMLVERKGIRFTWIHRFKRIVIPFLLSMITFGTLCAIVWGAGYAQLFGGTSNEWVERWLKSSWGIQTEFIPVVFGRLWHFWFLYVLIYFIVIGLIAHWAIPSSMKPITQRCSDILGWGSSSFFGPIVLSIPFGIMLIIIGSPNGPGPAHSINPVLGLYSYYALSFFAGWLLYARRETIDVLAKKSWFALTIGLSIAFPLHAWSLTQVTQSASEHSDQLSMMYITACMSRGLLTVTITFAFIGLFTLAFSKSGPRLTKSIRYISDSAYWVYIAHMPLVASISLWGFSKLDWSATLEMIVGSLFSMTLLLLSYEFVVRYTPIGTLLNGKRTRSQFQSTRSTQS